MMRKVRVVFYSYKWNIKDKRHKYQFFILWSDKTYRDITVVIPDRSALKPTRSSAPRLEKLIEQLIIKEGYGLEMTESTFMNLEFSNKIVISNKLIFK